MGGRHQDGHLFDHPRDRRRDGPHEDDCPEDGRLGDDHRDPRAAHRLEALRRCARSIRWIRSDPRVGADSWGLSMVSRSRETRGLGVTRGEDAYGQACGQAGALAGRAGDIHPAADGVDGVDETPQPGPFNAIGAANPVVGDSHFQRPSDGGDVHAAFKAES